MSHKRKTNDPPRPRMDQTQQFKKQKRDEINQIQKQIDHEYAAEQTHLKSIYDEKKLIGQVRVLLTEIDKVECGFVERLTYGNYIFRVPVTEASASLKKDQQTFLDRIHALEIQMRKSVQKQRELRKRQRVLVDEFNKLDVDENYKMG